MENYQGTDVVAVWSALSGRMLYHKDFSTVAENDCAISFSKRDVVALHDGSEVVCRTLARVFVLQFCN